MILRDVAGHPESWSESCHGHDLEEALMVGRIPRRVVALVAVILLAGVTLCLFDDDARLDLCNLLLLPVAGPVLGTPTLLVGRMVSVPIQLEPATPAEPPFPPPRS
jgi:hypothetical protein